MTAIRPQPRPTAAAQLLGWLQRAPVRALVEIAARIGYVARGVVYLCTGAIALLAAGGLTPSAKGPLDLAVGWAAWGPGLVLIAVTGSGLVTFAFWRAVQSILDADGHGHGAIGLCVRAGQGLSGVLHAGLALSLFDVMDGLDDVAEGQISGLEAMAATVLRAPHGDTLLIGIGAVVLAFGMGNLAQALFQDFAKRLGCSGAACDLAVRLARCGYIGRTLAFAPLGFFLIEAGLDARATEVRSLGQSLQVLEQQPFGPAILGLTALGLIAFGLFAFMEARFRTLIAAPAPTAHNRASRV